MDSEEGRLVAGRYRLRERIGAGGMGVVWKAYDERLSRTVALKRLLLPPHLDGKQAEDAKQRAMRESRIAARIQHPHVIAVYDVVEDEGQPCLVMEYVPSRSLSQLLEERGTLPPAEVARIGFQAAEALAAAHAVGVVHRDVKPGNVLLGERNNVKLVDFGIARATGDVTVTMTGLISGTPAFLAPEVARGERASYASDVYSLGATLYAAVEGEPPLGRTDNAIAALHRAASGQINPPRQAGPLGPVLLRLLDPDPTRRPTMDEVAGMLEPVAARAPLGAGFPVASADAPGGPGDASYGSPTLPEQQATARLPAESPYVSPTAPTQPVSPAWGPEPGPPPGDGWDGDDDYAGDEPGKRSRKTGWLLVALACFLGVAAAILLPTFFDDDESGESPQANPSTNQPRPQASRTPNPPKETPSQTPTENDEEEAEASPSPEDTADSTPTEPPVDPEDLAEAEAEAGQALEDYYNNVMPEDVEEGWSRLTLKYQEEVGTFEDNYEPFWSGIADVQATVLESEAEYLEQVYVTARVVYEKTDGTTSDETHRYTMVLVDGDWLIDGYEMVS
ncbi:MAG TPA: protein kinase [Actinopolymorphaceae bacterium]|jgi:serine/threonine protein kinase